MSSTSYFFSSASQLHPDAFPGAPGFTLTDSQQADLCRSALGLPRGPVTVNFWTFNNDCQQVAGWSGFIDAAWNHERQHFEQAETELKEPENNIYVELERIVRDSEFSAARGVTDVYNRIQGAAGEAAGEEPTGNWTTIPWWIWASDADDWFVPTDSTF